MKQNDIADALRRAGLNVPETELDELAEGVAILERLSARLAKKAHDDEAPGT